MKGISICNHCREIIVSEKDSNRYALFQKDKNDVTFSISFKDLSKNNDDDFIICQTCLMIAIVRGF